MAISFQSLQNILPILVTSKLPVLIRGRHGIGKSQVVFQLGDKLGLPVIDRRASQMTEGDLLGFRSNHQVTLQNGVLLNGSRLLAPSLLSFFGRGGSCNSKSVRVSLSFATLANWLDTSYTPRHLSLLV